jgi:hypothetical protein
MNVSGLVREYIKVMSSERLLQTQYLEQIVGGETGSRSQAALQLPCGFSDQRRHVPY